MVLPKNWAKVEAEDLIKHLRSRTMAGLPHIGILGPNQLNNIVDEPSTIEEDEYTQPTEDEEGLSEYPDWKFVPNKLAYQITLDSKECFPLKTKIIFYIRIKEGCDEDLAPVTERPENYSLSFNELLSAFKKYELTIVNESLFTNPIVSLKVDGETVPIKDGQIRTVTKKNEQTLKIRLTDQSDVFLVYCEGNPSLTKQKYIVQFKRSLTLEKDRLRVYNELKNLSPKTSRSVIPFRKRINHDELESEENVLLRVVGENKLSEQYSPKLFRIEGIGNNPSGNRYGYLLEVDLEEKISSSFHPFGEMDAAHTINCIMDDFNLKKSGTTQFTGKLSFRDHSMFEEEVPKMAPGLSPKDLSSELTIDENLEKVFGEDLEFNNFHLFQEKSIRCIMKAQESDSSIETVMISARTASGKTEAFLVPIAQYCIENRDKYGVKALVFYPTKALANDQTNRYIEILYHLNRRLKGKKITLGLLHGDIEKKEDDLKNQDEWELPLSCPKCDKGILRSEGNFLRCNSCNELIDFVKVRYRQQVYSDPPDILITNPDILIWDLMMRPQNHSIFGRPVWVCNDCGTTFLSKGIKRKCVNKGCNSSNLHQLHPSTPSFIVFDEVHMFKGTFGINCSFFISRLQNLLKKYSQKYNNNPSPKFVRIGSSATISNPGEFASDFFDTDPDNVHLVPKDNEEKNSLYLRNNTDQTIKRYHVYIMPYAYNTDSSIGRAINYIQNRSKNGLAPTKIEPFRGKPWDQYLQTITFVNSIRASNNLIALTGRTVANDLPDLKIGGHTTDFDKKNRARIERAFNRDELHCIFATQTLEVGVDFRRVDVVVVNGFPFSFNDYLQRIGRGGRRRDSLIITVCQHWKPIDHYYFSNARRSLRDPSANIEPVPITRNNIEASKKHVRGAVFDFIASEIELIDLFSDFRKFAGITSKIDDVKSYCTTSLGTKSIMINEVESALQEFLEYLENLGMNEFSPTPLISRFADKINKKYQLTSLRSTDREVIVEVLWNR